MKEQLVFFSKGGLGFALKRKHQGMKLLPDSVLISSHCP